MAEGLWSVVRSSVRGQFFQRFCGRAGMRAALRLFCSTRLPEQWFGGSLTGITGAEVYL